MKRVLPVAALALFAFAPALPVQAAVYTVTKTADTLDGACDRDCSLREAIVAANDRLGLDLILVGPGVYRLTLAGRDEDKAFRGDLDIRDELVILGAGADRTILDGGGIDRVLHVRLTGGLELHGATVRNGRALAPPQPPQFLSFFDGAGGGIMAEAPLALMRCLITGNHADLRGGGVFDFGRLIARDTTFSNNTAETGGGLFDVHLSEVPSFRLTNVTISGNRAGQGGGAFVESNDSEISQVTITGNQADDVGGLFIRNVLFGSSSTTSILVPASRQFNLSRSVIAANTDTSGAPDCKAFEPWTGGFNVIGVGDGCLPQPSDLVGSLAQPLDPGLTSLGSHGGPIPVHALREDSPAIDLAPPGSCERPADGNGDGVPGCDAGAVERRSGCETNEETLCLGADGRFRVTVHWTSPAQSGSGKAVPLTLDTGTFWFFDPANLELTVKVLDGCGVNGRFWVFLSGLTDVGIEVAVEDTLTKKIWTHEHQAGSALPPRLDTSALDSCFPIGAAQ